MSAHRFGATHSLEMPPLRLPTSGASLAPPIRRSRLALFILAVVIVLVARPASQHARAASLLMSFSSASSAPVREERISFLGSEHEEVPARLYLPNNVTSPPGVVLVHGVHYRGIDEPRLERFARAVAASGVAVMTPSVRELSDYKVAPHSIDTVGAAARELASRLGTTKVGLIGMSFGGGISLLTASDERFADDVSFVVAVGAHDDLGRVSRFFLDDSIERPTGEIEKLHAHGYGMMVLVYSRVPEFFPPQDHEAASNALRFWLQEKRDEARAELTKVTPSSRVKLEKLFGESSEDSSDLKREIAKVIDEHTEEMRRVSPRGHLHSIHANVYLLHGAGDTVIPAIETRWLAHDVPADRLKSALVSPAIEHVELKDSETDPWSSRVEKMKLVHFMGQILAEAEATR